jgi:hypothetical protein
MLQDDAYWRQRAKKHWYKDGDKNTKFFHASATARKKANCILSLEDDNGIKVTNSDALCSVAKKFFFDIFQQKPSHMTPVIDTIRQTVTNEDNIILTSPFIKEEFREAIFSMNPDKCPGPDGYNPGFYQHFWLFAVTIFSKTVVTGSILGSFHQRLTLLILPSYLKAILRAP